MMQTSDEISSVVADDDHKNASEVVNSMKESTNEVKNSGKIRRGSDLSLNVPPKKHVHFAPSPSGRTSPWEFIKSLSFKKKTVPDDENSPLQRPAEWPESPVITKFKSIFNFKRSASLPVKHESSNLSPPITTPASARTYSEQQKSQIRAGKSPVSRSLTTPLRNIVIVRSISFAARKDKDQIDRGDDQILPAEVEVEVDEEIDEEDAVCRICYDQFDEGNQFKLECSCKGALRLLHEKCLVEWFTVKGDKNCDVCHREVSNLPVTLFRKHSYVQRQNVTAQNQQGFNARTISDWQDIVQLVLISTLCYFFLIEQLLVNDLKTQAVMIAAPFAFTFGVLSSTFAVIMGKIGMEKYTWRYAVLEFAFVAIFLHLFYSWLQLQAIYAVMVSSVIGFGLAMALNALYIRFTEWRVRTSEGYNPI